MPLSIGRRYTSMYCEYVTECVRAERNDGPGGNGEGEVETI